MNEIASLVRKGGPLMVPIIALSVVALMVLLERLYALRRGRVIPADFLGLVRKKVRERRPAEALTLCEGNPSPISSVVASGLRKAGRPREVVKEAFEEVGRLEVVHLGRFVEVLGAIAAVQPLLGLLGTVTGMIGVFQTIMVEAGQAAGRVNPTSLASGIWEALVTTVAGLSAAIPAYLGYKFLLSRVDRLSIEMEEASLELLDLLTEGPETMLRPAPPTPSPPDPEPAP